MDKNKTNNLTSVDFERKIDELQKIVDKLESDSSISLEDSMALYESGLSMTKDCVNDLNVMQARITDLNKQLDAILLQPLFGEKDE